MRILLVEDDPSLQTVVGFALRKAGHDVEVAGTLAAAREALARGAPEFVVLDVMLPDGDGFSLAREVEGLPWLFLTSRSEEIDRVLGFSLGADDYVTKPFSLAELTLRIEAIARRARPAATRVAKDPTEEPVRGLRLDDAARTAHFGGRALDLTKAEFDLLAALLKHRRQVCTREMLLDLVTNENLDVADRAIDAHVKRLRRKFAGLGVDPIKTVRGVGYRYEVD